MAAGSPVTVTTEDGLTCVRFLDASILDSGTIQFISAELAQLIELPEHQRIVLDFREVRFLASQALGMLLGLRARARGGDTEIALAAVRPELSRIFKLAGIEKMFRFYSSADDAREQWK